MNINLTLIGQAISFAIFVWFCMKYVWPPITSALDQRKKTIADGLSAAELGQQSLEKAKVDVEEKLTEAKSEAKNIIAMAEKRQSDILDEANIESEDLIVQETDVDKLRDDKHIIYDKKLLKFLKNYQETYVNAPKLS